MPRFARTLGSILDRVVVDQTGLSGRFMVSVLWKNEGPRSSNQEEEQGRAELPGSAFVALEEQAGLKLRATRGPVEVLVIDHVESPSEN